MNQAQNKKTPSPPGVFTTLTFAFDLTTRHLWLLVLPFLLDMFYWLGPRLSVESLVERNALAIQNEAAVADFVDQMVQLASQFNLFTSLSIPLIGIPALMNGPIPGQTPLIPSVLQVEDTILWLALFFCFSLVGLVLTAIYLGLIGFALRDYAVETGFGVAQFVGSLVRITVRLFGLGIVFVVALFIVWLPMLPLAFVLGLIASGLFAAVMLFGFVLVAVYFSLAVPGIVFQERPVKRAVIDSVRLVHRNLLPTLNLLLLVLLIGSGMNLLWHLADNGSWLTVVSIVGHAFISTALISAIFIYYRDRSIILHSQSN